MSNEIVKIDEYKEQVSFIEEKANKLVIESEQQMNDATDLLGIIKNVEKAVLERKLQITKPLMDALSSTRELFKPLELITAHAEKTIKGKMLDYTVTQEEKISAQRVQIEDNLKKGNIKLSTAISKLEQMKETPKNYTGSQSKISFRDVLKVKISNEELIPREYMVPDTTKIADAVLRRRVKIPGVETYKERIVSSRKS